MADGKSVGQQNEFEMACYDFDAVLKFVKNLPTPPLPQPPPPPLSSFSELDKKSCLVHIMGGTWNKRILFFTKTTT